MIKGVKVRCQDPQMRLQNFWERDFVALEEMNLEDAACQSFESNNEVYRKGAVGSNCGKSGGGCGCT
jgi:hypothetical protein